MNKREIGKYCESKIEEKFISLGYIILNKNFKVGKSSEIDIIAQKEDILHFIEVKSRSNTSFGFAIEAVDRNKIYKIIKASELYMKINNIYDIEISYDVAEVYYKIKNERIEIENIEIHFSAF